MEMCFIYPPLSVNEYPHLALPLLKGYLKKQGIHCLIKDYNVEIMDIILTERMEKIQEYFRERGIRISLKEIQNRYKNAKNVFLLKERSGMEDMAQRLINSYLKIAGANISEVCFQPDSFYQIKNEYVRTDINWNTNPIISYIRDIVLPYFSKKSFKVIGISVSFTSQIYYALILGRELKKVLPDCKVVMGGPQISLFWKLFMDYRPFHNSFDALIYGMGEIALEKYLFTIYTNGDLSKVPNLIYLGSDGQVIKNDERILENMENIPIPDFSDLPLDKYIYGKLPYQMSRGCYWGKCAFCSYRNNNNYIIRKVDTVAEELSEMEKRYGRHIFQFIDDAIPPTILDKFAETIIRKNMKIRYDAYLRLDAGFTIEKCRLLAESGLKNVLFGFESANQRVLNLMKKGNSPDNMVQVMKNMKKAGIQSILSCLIGFPTETREEALESIRFLKENREWYYWVYLVHFGLISDMCKNSDIYGIYDVDYNNLIRYDDSGFAALGYPYKNSVGMTTAEAYEIIKEGRKELGITISEDNFFS